MEGEPGLQLSIVFFISSFSNRVTVAEAEKLLSPSQRKSNSIDEKIQFFYIFLFLMKNFEKRISKRIKTDYFVNFLPIFKSNKLYFLQKLKKNNK